MHRPPLGLLRCPDRYIRARRKVDYSRANGRAPSRLVRDARALSPLERHEGSVRDPRLRSHAAADTGRARDPALARLARALADTRCARCRDSRRCDPSLAGARLQPPRAQPAPRRVRDRRTGVAGGSHRPPRRGALHRRRDPQPGVRRAGAARGHERRRIQERTGHAFGPDALQALFDLGATVCLARVPRCEVCPLAEACPSRGRRYGPLRKQSAFEGSFRQRRALLLREVAAEPRLLDTLDREAVESLLRDGLIERAGEVVQLPS